MGNRFWGSSPPHSDPGTQAEQGLAILALPYGLQLGWVSFPFELAGWKRAWRSLQGTFYFLQSKPGGGIHQIFSYSIGWKAVKWPHLRQAEKYSLDTCPEIKRRT